MLFRSEFLTASGELIACGDIPAITGSVLGAASALGDAPLLVTLTSPTSAPFHVARVLIPGFVPLSFGWDNEPLGLPRLAAPLVTLMGERVGARLDLAHAGPVAPHPLV